MLAERADNYEVLKNIKKSDLRTGIMIEFVVNKILELARETGEPITTPITIIDADTMTEEEQEMAIFESYLKRGYTPEIAEKKAKELIKLEKAMFKE